MQQLALTAQVNKKDCSNPLSFFFLLKIEFNTVVAMQKEMDWVGDEPTTSAMPIIIGAMAT